MKQHKIPGISSQSLGNFFYIGDGKEQLNGLCPVGTTGTVLLSC